MSIYLDLATTQLNKTGEELCGDSIEVVRTEDATIIVLSDGLGSGVKANILSRLTTKTAATMLSLGGTVDEVINTLAHTLPICQVRHLAYSTFTIVKISLNGEVYLAEYDNPPAFIGSGANLREVNRQTRVVGDKKIRESYFKVTDQDWLVLVSDGVLHAGIGNTWNMEWNWKRVGRYIAQEILHHKVAEDWAQDLSGLIFNLYGGKPGDDASAIVIKIGRPRQLTILIGPPKDPAKDSEVVAKLIKAPGLKSVCGGTTINLVMRELNYQVENIDLVMENSSTIVYALEQLRNGTDYHDLKLFQDGTSRLTAAILQADNIHFIIGTAENPVQDEGDTRKVMFLKQQVLKDLISFLREEKSKNVFVEYY